MKRCLIQISWFMISVNAVMGQGFYDVETVNTIELIFSQSNWNEILDSLVVAGEEERLMGTAVINGEQFDSVGVRYKGNSTYNPNQVKNPLNIKLDYIIEEQNIEGYGTLKFTNVYKDPSFIREVLSYEIARNYMPAGQANFINVYINDELIGLFTNCQSVDRFFLDNHFNSRDNACFKGELTGGGPQVSEVWGYNGPDSTSYFNFYEMESDEGWGELIEFLDLFNNNSAVMEDILDVDRHLWMLAYDILMVNLDAPVNFGHNFYLYKDDNNRFNPLIWDLNENFGGFSMILGGGPPLSVSQMQQLDPFLNISNPDYPIINKVLPDPTYQKMYLAHMRTMIEDNFANDWYISRALEIQDIIDADVQADPNKFYSYNDFLTNIYSQVGFGPQQIVGIEQLMDARADYLLNLPVFQAVPPRISNIAHNPTVITPNDLFWITAEIEQTDDVNLCFRDNSQGRFEKTPMFDDGNHHDGAANDGIYGASVEAGFTDIQYYIYAENSEAAAFSPAGAEYEYYVIPVVTDFSFLVINEFMADNETTITDPQGEYEDWVEIWNGGMEAVNLGGLFLTDDLNIPDKWTFPDTVVQAESFILIWTDDDENDPGLHTNFKLSAGGEEIGLFTVDTSGFAVIDTITFTSQAEDTSFGRYPDGGSEWGFMNPTPEYGNEPLMYVPGSKNAIEDFPEEFAIVSVSPNPFNNQTRIVFSLKTAGKISLTIYNTTGREVARLIDNRMEAGKWEIDFHCDGLASGLYFARLETIGGVNVRKMILLK